MTTARIVPEETSVLDAATEARNAGHHLLCNGRQTCISPVPIPGWCKVSVLLKPRRQSPKEPISCAA